MSKEKLRTSEDILHRIQWDDGYDLSAIMLGSRHGLGIRTEWERMHSASLSGPHVRPAKV